MIIENNIVKHYLKNVYFITGTAYAGKSTAVKMLAERYGKLFRILLKAKKEDLANVTSVTFWGMKDDESWLTGFRKEKSYPMLFDDNYEPKAAYYAVVKAVEEFV